MLGAVGLGSALPMLTISLFGGVLADSMRKKTILLAGQFASAFVALGIAVSITPVPVHLKIKQKISVRKEILFIEKRA